MSAQRELLRQVYERYRIDPGSIGYVEAHGTGTKLGDPVELQALSEHFRPSARGAQRCALGSVKSNIGHSSAAAGVAGVHKVLLCLQHRELVPSVHYRHGNEHFDFSSSPLWVNTQHSGWEVGPGETRRAGVSSFGYSGTNAHVVIEEYVEAAAPSAGPEEVLVLLSGRTPQALREQVYNLQRYLSAPAEVDLVRLAYTLQVGRAGLAHRAAWILSTHAQLQQSLQHYLHAGLAAPSQGPPVGSDARLTQLAHRYLHGEQIPWQSWQGLYPHTPVPLSLPTYPFEKLTCWFSEAPGAARARPRQFLHPLLHANTSDL